MRSQTGYEKPAGRSISCFAEIPVLRQPLPCIFRSDLSLFTLNCRRYNKSVCIIPHTGNQPIIPKKGRIIMKKRTLLACLLAVCIGANILLPPPPVPPVDPEETIMPLNDITGIEKS